VVSARRLPALAAATAAVAAAAVVLAGVGTGWWGSGGGGHPVAALAAAAALSERTVAFGDPVEARLDIVVDRARVNAGAVQVVARFAPYVVRALPTERHRSGDATALRLRWSLTCLVEACLPAAASRVFSFPPARIQGGGRTVATAWPTLEVTRRTTAADEARTTPAWRLDASLPPATPGASASTLAWLLGGGAALLLLLAGGVLAVALRPGPREQRRLEGLMRALALAREAAVAGGDAERRRALETLAAALGHGAADGLADAARRLAWSEQPPGGEQIAELVARIVAAEAA
jgi:hypothetical protein